MKKKSLLFISLLMTLLIFTGCGKEKAEDILYKVLSNEKEFKLEDKEYKLEVYMKDSPKHLDTIAYTYVDMDKDGTKELVTYLSGADAEYIVFRYNDKTIYGYKYSMKDFQDLRENGIYKSVVNEDAYAYLSTKFENNNKVEISNATTDGKKYTVDNVESSKEAFESKENEISSVNKAEFKKYK